MWLQKFLKKWLLPTRIAPIRKWMQVSFLPVEWIILLHAILFICSHLNCTNKSRENYAHLRHEKNWGPESWVLQPKSPSLNVCSETCTEKCPADFVSLQFLKDILSFPGQRLIHLLTQETTQGLGTAYSDRKQQEEGGFALWSRDRRSMPLTPLRQETKGDSWHHTSLGENSNSYWSLAST